MRYDPEQITYFAETDFRNQKTKFGIKAKDRARHMYVIGKTGVGKSTLLENMAVQDVANGNGVGILDPHGSFADKILEYIPQHRITDVIYFAPFDTEYPISFNILEDVGADKRHFVVSGLMSTFKKIWVDAWSARMEYILNNILFALLEYPGATLLGVNRMLADKEYRKKVVENVTDPGVKTFWLDEFAKYGDRYMQEAGAAIQNKIGQFSANPLIRNMIGQPKSSFDFRRAMDEGKIIVMNLSKGKIGEQNTSLLGSMLITKIYLSAMSRADVHPTKLAELPNFYFYVDEFQSFANETFANILAEARKYKLNLTIAHQYVAQMEEQVRDAVFGNVGTTISFRVGPLDAELLEKVFSSEFTANDLVSLGMAQIYLTLMIDGMGSKPFSATTLPPIPFPEISYKDDVIEYSRKTYAASKESVQNSIEEFYVKEETPPEPKKPYVPRDRQSFSQGGEQRGNFQSNQQPPLRPNNGFTPRPKPTRSFEPRAERPETHQPFRNAFQTEKPAEPILETGTSLSAQKKEETPALSQLLSSLHLEDKKQEERSQPHKESFTDDENPFLPKLKKKPLQHGPTEANKNLLREALAKAGTSSDTMGNEQPATSGEVSTETLRKVLE